MKKFAIVLTAFVVSFLLIDFAIGKSFSAVEDKLLDYPMTYNTITDYTAKHVKDDVVIIGASTANHHYNTQIIKDSLNLTAFNAGKDGCFFLYNTAVIDLILNRYTPKLIIWDINPLWLRGSNPQDFQRLSGLNSYYDHNSYVKELLLQKSPMEKWKMYCHAYRYNSRITGYLKTFMGLENSCREDGYSPISATGYSFPSIKEQVEEDKLDRQSELYFIQALQKCKEKDVEIVLSFSPLLMRTNYLETIQYQRMKTIADSLNIPIIDNYHNDIFMRDSTLFKDNAHLNSRGSDLFTDLFIKELKD